MNPFRITNTRTFQRAFLGLLLVCVAQLGFWVWDELRFIDNIHEDWIALHNEDVVAAQVLLGNGHTAAEVHTWFPNLVVVDGQATLDPAVREDMERLVHKRTNRFRWEGGFFLVILATGTYVLTRSLALQEDLRKRKDNFLAAVSHELKSPLASIRLGAETLGLREASPEATRKWLGRILDEVARLETMINNLLYASHMGDGDLLHAPEPLLFRAPLHQVLDELKPRLAAHSTEVVVEVPDDLVIRADAAGLHSVLRNLLDNAVKATSRCREPRLQIRAERRNGMAQVSVEDNGTGFEPEQAEELFRRFFRLGDEMRRRTTGSGLGLYLVKRFVERDGGQVSAHSAGPGQGATFEVSWPVAEESTP